MSWCPGMRTQSLGALERAWNTPVGRGAEVQSPSQMARAPFMSPGSSSRSEGEQGTPEPRPWASVRHPDDQLGHAR